MGSNVSRCKKMYLIKMFLGGVAERPGLREAKPCDGEMERSGVSKGVRRLP